MIKVLRIVTRLNIGGPAQNVAILTAGLNSKNTSTVLVTGCADDSEGDMSYLVSKNGVTTIIVPEMCRKISPCYDFVAFLKLFKIIKKEKPDIIHTHTAKAGSLGRIAGIMYNFFYGKHCKFVHTFHGHVLSEYFNSLITWTFINIERLLALFTDRIIAVSESVKHDLLSLKIGTPEKIHVIPLGFDLEPFFKLEPRNGQAGDSCFNIGIVGRLVPVKNHKVFIDAARDLLLSQYGNRKVEFFIIGDGELRVSLEKYAAGLGINKNLIFTSWKSDMPAVYNMLDIVVLTSLNEGTPVSLIEAMASGRAVIATEVGGVKDILQLQKSSEYTDASLKVTSVGILIRSKDAKALSRGMGMLISDDSLRKRLGLNGRSFVREKFQKERLVADTEKLYNTLTNGQRRPN